MLSRTSIYRLAGRQQSRIALITLALVALLQAAMIGAGCSRNESTEPGGDDPSGPNIVFVMIDTLRADRLGGHGSAPSLTPVMDEIAGEGVLFERATSQAPWTLPSMASLYVSRYPQLHGMGRRIRDPKGSGRIMIPVLHESWVTLAETLQAAGYETAGFVGNPWTAAKNGFAQGYDHYDEDGAKNETDGAQLNQKIRAWLEQRKQERKFFLFVHYMDVHGPYWAPEKLLKPLLSSVERLPEREPLTPAQYQRLGYLAAATQRYPDQRLHKKLEKTKAYWIARYDAGVRYADQHVGELREILKAAKAWDDALVVITADHGEELLEHGQWNHGHTLYQEQLAVPLLMRWTGALPAAKRVPDRVQLIDVMPTLLEWVGVEGPKGMQGASMVSLLNGEHWRRPAFAQASKVGRMRAVLIGDWKMIDFGKNGGRQVFDLAKDPQERRPMPAAKAPDGARLSKAMDRVISTNQALLAGRNVETKELDQKEVERLRTLGYTK